MLDYPQLDTAGFSLARMTTDSHGCKSSKDRKVHVRVAQRYIPDLTYIP